MRSIKPKEKEIEPIRFSQHFNLSQDNGKYEFVDIYVYRDIALFLDPYGITTMGNDWSRDCELQIATYFQYLVDSIKRGDKKATAKLLNALHEVDEVSLGYSKEEPKGRGIGSIQAREIQLAFESSEAAKSGDIKDIADCALMIPGINRDKISDITANILKRKLIEFTQKQCRKHLIPMEEVAVNNAFDYSNFQFTSYYADLPVINGKAKILLPKSSVRHDPELSKGKYYRNFVLEFLRAEHEHAGDSLASILKNGRVVVRIADLKEKYPMGSDFLYQFSKQHPQVLEKYKSELKRTARNSIERPVLNPPKKILTAQERAQILFDIQPGNKGASDFHKISYDNLIHIFGNRLSNPNSEVKTNEGRKRIDIVFDNHSKEGFFSLLNTVHHIQCPKIFVECKNYSEGISNPEIDQLLGRFSDKRGRFGILLCRSIADQTNLLKRCKDVLNDQKGYIIVLADADINNLLKLKEKEDEIAIDNYMNKKFDQLIM